MPPKSKKKGAPSDAAGAGDGGPPAKAAKLNKTDSDFSAIDFSSDCKTKGGDKWDFKVSSWNVDGMRAWAKKGGADFIKHEQPDVICFQETKCNKGNAPAEVIEAIDSEYPHRYWHSSTAKEGYSGVAMFSKQKPISVEYGLGAEAEEFDAEGRLITAEFDTFFLLTTYVPNAGRKLVTLDKRMKWDPLLRKHMKALDKRKPVVLCGDLNVAHLEIDLANPKTNKKNAGFTKEERDGCTELMDSGFADTFRHFYPKKEKAYTFWTYMMNCRAKNVGWRLDYFLVSKRIVESHVCDNVIRDQVFGSDHCPISLFMKN